MANPHVIGPARPSLFTGRGWNRAQPEHQYPAQYRDTLRLLFHFLAERYATEPTQVTVEHLTVDVIKHFLTYLEEEGQYRRHTESAAHGPACLLPLRVPADSGTHRTRHRSTTCPYAGLFSQRSRTLSRPKSMPYWRPRIALPYRASVTTLAPVPVQHRGSRHRSGPDQRRALQLDSAPAAVRFLGKGRKVRLCPLWSHTVEVLRGLLGSRLAGRDACRCSSTSASADHPFRHAHVGRADGRKGCQHDAIAAAEKSQSAYDSSHHRRRFAPRWGRYEHHTSLANPRLIGDTNRYAQSTLAMKAKALETCAPITWRAGEMPLCGTRITISWLFLPHCSSDLVQLCGEVWPRR